MGSQESVPTASLRNLGLFQKKKQKFVSDAEETDSIHDGKTIMMYNRLLLLDIYCKNNVTHVFSGSRISYYHGFFNLIKEIFFYDIQ